MNAVILDKGAPIPSTRTHCFELAKPNQTNAIIEILQGQEGASHSQCLVLGYFELTGMTPIEKGAHKIEICLKIDKNGMLNAAAYDPESGVSADLNIDYKNGNPKRAA